MSPESYTTHQILTKKGVLAGGPVIRAAHDLQKAFKVYKVYNIVPSVKPAHNKQLLFRAVYVLPVLRTCLPPTDTRYEHVVCYNMSAYFSVFSSAFELKSKAQNPKPNMRGASQRHLFKPFALTLYVRQ